MGTHRKDVLSFGRLNEDTPNRGRTEKVFCKNQQLYVAQAHTGLFKNIRCITGTQSIKNNVEQLEISL